MRRKRSLRHQKTQGGWQRKIYILAIGSKPCMVPTIKLRDQVFLHPEKNNVGWLASRCGRLHMPEQSSVTVILAAWLPPKMAVWEVFLKWLLCFPIVGAIRHDVSSYSARTWLEANLASSLTWSKFGGKMFMEIIYDQPKNFNILDDLLAYFVANV